MEVETLPDTGATAQFIDPSLAHHFQLNTLDKPCTLTLADGTPTSTSITQTATMFLTIGTHTESLNCYVTKLGKHKLILGLGWMNKHQPRWDWPNRALVLDSDYCSRHCAGCRKDPDEKRKEPETQKELDLGMVTLSEFEELASTEGHEISLLMPQPEEPLLQISLMELMGAGQDDTESLQLAALKAEDLQKFMSKSHTDPKDKLPAHYSKYLDVFSRDQADELPPHRVQDHAIDLVPNQQPPFKRGYKMSQDELSAIKSYIDEHLAKGYIRRSSSPAAAPVLLVRKPGGGLRFCVDYRCLNAVTVKNRYPIPLIRETLDKLSKARYFTKLDIIAAFNKIRIRKGDEWKTAFNTRYGQYEYLVMPFGLCNAPGTFQSYINAALHDYLDQFCTGYIDDILIFSETLEEHRTHVKQVLERLRAFGLFADIDKSEFEVQSVKYLGLIITTEGLRMDENKISAVKDWPTPRSVKDV